MKNLLKPLSVSQFESIAKNNNVLDINDYLGFFSKEIEDIANYAMSDYFWLIGNNVNLSITNTSENIGQLTPYNQSKWVNGNFGIFMEVLHDEDKFFVLRALQLAIEKIESLPADRQKKVRVNIYARMLNAKNEYRWVLIQIPGLYINNETFANCALIMITDLSHIIFKSKPIMFTFTDNVNNQNEYYQTEAEPIVLKRAYYPKISKREQEILGLMAKGLTSKEISAQVNRSFHTIENHKRNLRQKTNSKTSAELIDFVWRNNLI